VGVKATAYSSSAARALNANRTAKGSVGGRPLPSPSPTSAMDACGGSESHAPAEDDADSDGNYRTSSANSHDDAVAAACSDAAAEDEDDDDENADASAAPEPPRSASVIGADDNAVLLLPLVPLLAVEPTSTRSDARHRPRTVHRARAARVPQRSVWQRWHLQHQTLVRWAPTTTMCGEPVPDPGRHVTQWRRRRRVQGGRVQENLHAVAAGRVDRRECAESKA
jgi:hypothetical protein